MPEQNPLTTAIVTGGHPFDVQGFHQLFRSLEGIDAYVQHLDDFASAPEEVRDAYDVVVFYIMFPGEPTNDGIPWYSGEPRTALDHLGTTKQGIVVLHHAVVSYPDYSLWTELVGIGTRNATPHFDVTIRTEVADSDHPISQGIQPWKMVDESYEMDSPDQDSRPLLTTDHPDSMRVLAWTRQFRNARVFCYQSGHDEQAWKNPAFRTILGRGILWTVEQL